MKAAAKIQKEIDRLKREMVLTHALEAAHLELSRIEQDRKFSAEEAKLQQMREVVEAAERRETERQKIEVVAACEGVSTTHPMSARLAELRPVFTADGVLFPLPHFVSLGRMVDELRLSDPHLFHEPVIEEPHSDFIDEVRRDRWGDVPNDE